jgi:hypothetical protein
VFSNFFFSEDIAVCVIMWKNIVEPSRPQMTIWRMRIACWIPKATNTYSQYVIPIALPLQQWLDEQPAMLHFTYIACLVHNRDGVCLLRGTDWIFTYSSGLMSPLRSQFDSEQCMWNSWHRDRFLPECFCFFYQRHSTSAMYYVLLLVVKAVNAYSVSWDWR